MSQDFNQPGAGDSISTGRTLWNSCLNSLKSMFSGTSAPGSQVVGQLWADTTGAAERIKIRNADDDAWIVLGDLDNGILIPYTASFQFTLAAGSYSSEKKVPLAIMPFDGTLVEAKFISSGTSASSGVSKKWLTSIHNETEGVDISSADLDSNTAEFVASAPQTFSLTGANTDLAAGDVLEATIQSVGSPTSMQHYTWTWQLQIARRT